MGEKLEERLDVHALFLEPLPMSIFLLVVRGIFGESVFEEAGQFPNTSRLNLRVALALQVDAHHLEVGAVGSRLHFGPHCNYI